MMTQRVLFSRHERIVLFGLYALALAITTHTPGVRVPTTFEYTDKVIHLSAFAGLTVLACIALRPRRLAVAGLALTAYAALDEWTQQFVGRHTDIFDWIADTLGVWLALGLVALVRARWRRQASSSSTSSSA